MARHGVLRARPAELVPGTLRVISARLDYCPAGGARSQPRCSREPLARLRVALRARPRLPQGDAARDCSATRRRASPARSAPFGHRVFADSAPVMEVALAARAGTRLARQAHAAAHAAGILVLPGRALHRPAAADDGAGVGALRHLHARASTPARPARSSRPYELDARRCISYLTIELAGPIPEELRPAIGNRIYGCDDCQLACPWNRYAADRGAARLRGRPPRPRRRGLVDLFAWTREEFDPRMEGSAIRRIGHERWLRNLAVALGNAPAPPRWSRRCARAPTTLAAGARAVAWALGRRERPDEREASQRSRCAARAGEKPARDHERT